MEENKSITDIPPSTSFRLPVELQERVREACYQRRTTKTAAVIEGLEWWLAGEATAKEPPKPAESDLTAGLSPKDRARVVALIEMLSGGSTGVEHLDLMKAPVIGYLDTWASQTRKPSSGKKASGKNA